MRKMPLLLLLIIFTFTFSSNADESHHSQGILLDTMATKVFEYEQLDELINDSDLIVEAIVLENQEVTEEQSYPSTTISTLYIEDILFAKNDVDFENIKLIEHGDYRYHLDIVKEGEKHILFLKQADSILDGLLPLVNDPEALSEAPFVTVDQWQGKYNITEANTTFFYADKERIKSYQEQLSKLPHKVMKEEIKAVITKLKQ